MTGELFVCQHREGPQYLALGPFLGWGPVTDPAGGERVPQSCHRSCWWGAGTSILSQILLVGSGYPNPVTDSAGGERVPQSCYSSYRVGGTVTSPAGVYISPVTGPAGDACSPPWLGLKYPLPTPAARTRVLSLSEQVMPRSVRLLCFHAGGFSCYL